MSPWIFLPQTLHLYTIVCFIIILWGQFYCYHLVNVVWFPILKLVSSPILKLYAKSRVPFWNHETQVLLSFINWGIKDNLIPQIPSENIWCSICQCGLYNTSHTLYTVKRGFNFTSLDCVLFLRQPLMITSLTFTFMITSKQCIYMIVL